MYYVIQVYLYLVIIYTLWYRRALRRQLIKEKPKKVVKGDSKATVTPLVSKIFDSLFQGQIDMKDTGSLKRKRCGVCEVGHYSISTILCFKILKRKVHKFEVIKFCGFF